MKATLTPRDRAVLAHLWRHPGASLRELAAAVGLVSTSSVVWHLKRLNHSGYIKRGPFHSERTNTLTPAGLLAAQGWEIIFWEAE